MYTVCVKLETIYFFEVKEKFYKNREINEIKQKKIEIAHKRSEKEIYRKIVLQLQLVCMKSEKRAIKKIERKKL